jgi:RNA polymerase sigma-70 factor (ECF subfamily)
MLDTSEEQKIISDVIEGQTDRYRLLVERYHRGLISHLTNLLHGDQAQAEDIAQEAFIRAFDKLHQYDSNYAFSTWLYKIADNMSYRLLKQAKKTVQIETVENSLPDDGVTLGERLDLKTTKQAVRSAVKTLSPQYQQVLTLYYWENFSYEQIATVIDRPIGTVRTWLFRAKDELRKELNGQA